MGRDIYTFGDLLQSKLRSKISIDVGVDWGLECELAARSLWGIRLSECCSFINSPNLSNPQVGFGDEIRVLER